MQKPWPLAALHLNSSWEEGFHPRASERSQKPWLRLSSYLLTGKMYNYDDDILEYTRCKQESFLLESTG